MYVAGIHVSLYCFSLIALPVPGPPVPTQWGAGCYILYPTGCPKREHIVPNEWQRDLWGEVHRTSGRSHEDCMARKRSIEDGCGAWNVVMLYVPCMICQRSVKILTLLRCL